MDWQRIDELLRPAYRYVATAVKRAYPNVVGGACEKFADIGVTKFAFLMAFTHHPVADPAEEVSVEFTCAKSRAFRNPDESLYFPSAAEQDAVKFAVEHLKWPPGGSRVDPTIAALGLKLLPEGSESDEYRDAVIEYADLSAVLLRSRVDSIVAAVGAHEIGGP